MKIYFYSFPMAYEDQLELNRKPILKIGQTTLDDVEDRILQQMGTATPQRYNVKGQYKVSFTDKEFHRFLVARGVKKPDGYGTEWFYITAEKANSLLLEFAAVSSGVATPIRSPLDIRPYQFEFVKQFMSTTGDFLLAAKCRSGKSVMGLMAATEAGFKSLLVVSLRTSAGNSWLTDPTTFTMFHEWDVIDTRDNDAASKIEKSLATGRRILMVGTVQGTDSKFPLQAKLKKLFPGGIDALYLDECHIGGLAQMVANLKKSLTFGRVMEISGTAFKASWFYSRGNTFVWDYIKEQTAKQNKEAWAQKMPSMELVVARYDSEKLSKIYGDTPDRINNLWSIESGEWKDSASVRNFITRFFVHGGQVHKKKQLFHGSDHIVMSLPSVDACHLLAKTFLDLAMPWVPLVITGDTGANQDTILEHVKSNPRTICFTRWANVVGVTVPEWDTVVHGAATDSVEFWVQFSFRGGSTTRNSWKVVDFSPEQAVNSVIEMVQAASESGEDETLVNPLRVLLDFADFHEFNDGFTKLNYESLIEVATSNVEVSVELLKRRAAWLGSYGEYSKKLAQAFAGVEGVKDEEVVNTVINANETKNTGNLRINRNGNATSINNMKRLLAKIKGALQCLPSLVAVSTMAGKPVTTVFQMLSSPNLKLLTGVNRGGFEEALSNHWISERELSNVLLQTNLILDHSLL